MASALKQISSLLNINFKKILNFEIYNIIDGKRFINKDIPVFNPATGKIVCHIPESSEHDVNSAVESSEKAFNIWKSKSCQERSNVMYKAAEILKENFDNFVDAEVKDSGKPIWEAKQDVNLSIDCIKYFAGLASNLAITGQHLNLGPAFAYVVREPIGVVAAIGVWNYPLLTASWKAGPSLACGNALIYKPSPLTPITAVMLAEAFHLAGLPPACFNVLHGGAQAGSLLASHRGIGKISFTGSAPTGQKVMEASAKSNLKRVTLELGGKSPLIIFSDAPLPLAVKCAMLANFPTQGATCSNGTRVFVHEDIHDAFLDLLISKVEQNMKVGDPESEHTMVGATITPQHAQKVLGFISRAKSEGAKVMFGGQQVKLEGHLSDGTFLTPCILTDCRDEMEVCREEVFGSVMALLKFKDEDEVIRRANCTPYGLSGGVVTYDLNRAHRVASKIKSGTFCINNYNINPPQLPFGGWKMSGFGHECGTQALDHFSQFKSVYIDTRPHQDIACPYFDGLPSLNNLNGGN